MIILTVIWLIDFENWKTTFKFWKLLSYGWGGGGGGRFVRCVKEEAEILLVILYKILLQIGKIWKWEVEFVALDIELVCKVRLLVGLVGIDQLVLFEVVKDCYGS